METKASNARKISPLSRAVAQQICAERSALRLNQKEGYQLVGMAKGVYIRIEKAERPADIPQLEQIAAAYGLTVTTLLSRASELLASGKVVMPKTNAQKAQDHHERNHPTPADPAEEFDAAEA